MNNPITTYKEFSEALRQVSEKIDELSDTLNEFAAKVAEAWSCVWFDTQAEFVESMTTFAALYDKVNRDKLPRPSHGVYFKGKEYNYGTYRYIKDFQRNLPYQRRRY